MTTVPPSGLAGPSFGPGFASSDFAAMQSQLIQQQVQAEVNRITKQYQERLDGEAARIIERLQANANKHLRLVVTAVVASIIALFAVLVTAQTSSVNSSVIGFQNSVMNLQTQVVATQKTINEASVALANKTAALDGAGQKLKDATDRAQAVAAEYTARLNALPQQTEERTR